MISHFPMEIGVQITDHRQAFSYIKESHESWDVIHGPWCDVIVLNVHTPMEDKHGDIKYSFYEELNHRFDKFLKWHMYIKNKI
jgi:hypothetical protein